MSHRKIEDSHLSNILDGFRFIQKFWAGTPQFPSGKNNSTPGFDGVIGENSGQSRSVSGMDPTNFTRDLNILTDFVVPIGGEYFFAPPISALSTGPFAP
ncbi:hypothetical protein M422DRAFT_786025 [Sphaerobolus stellatus SS14]|uniref:Uncharacterized protein n=1 Tax=Sphaerobolus stellatus (strain SS14) TaxID=990650 RepID=A0A0C9TPT0_SPHS4|nr:hypothetical protein M422DRAFT_786025 [Sphaerobolus stellatus SS14]